MVSGDVQHGSRTLLDMSLTRRPITLVVFVVASLSLVACGDDESASVPNAPPIDVGDPAEYQPQIDPADFVASIDNPHLPFERGSRWVYESLTQEGLERIEVVVTDEAHTVMGVDVTVVRDTVTLDGRVTEDTWDWYAQDGDGNVWYFGEDTKEFDDDGSVSTKGSWEAGVDGAEPGIVMYADPQVGQAYRQEFYAGEAEDVAKVVRVGARADVAAGAFEDLIVILEWNPFEPEVLEEKYYANGVGPVMERKLGGDVSVELVEFAPAT